MTENPCKRTERKIRHLGYGRMAAHRYAGFFWVSMLSVCGVMGGLRRRRGHTGIVEAVPRHILRTFAALLRQIAAGTGAGTTIADARPVPFLSADFRQRR